MKKILAILFTALLLAVPPVSAAGGNTHSALTLAPSSPTQGEIESLSVPFQADRCVVVKKIVITTEKGFTVETMGGQRLILSFANKVGANANVKVGSEVEIMVGPTGQVYGWKLV